MSLNFIYYPISFIMRLWYKFFCLFFGLNSCIPWILSVIFLVLTIRIFLFPTALKQIRNTRLMKKYAPELQAIAKKYKNDPQARFAAQKEFQQEHGIKMLAGCLPQLIQFFVFIGLYHVLQGFNGMSSGGFNFFNHKHANIEQARNSTNYFFTQPEVARFLDARAFGVPLSTYITQPQEQFKIFIHAGETINFSRWNIAAVLAPLMIISALATHFNARASINRQMTDESTLPGMSQFMNFLMLWVFPLGTLFTGFVMPGSILLYFMTNNISTYIQTHLIHWILEKESHKETLESKSRVEDKLKPKPGAKPKRT